MYDGTGIAKLLHYLRSQIDFIQGLFYSFFLLLSYLFPDYFRSSKQDLYSLNSVILTSQYTLVTFQKSKILPSIISSKHTTTFSCFPFLTITFSIFTSFWKSLNSLP